MAWEYIIPENGTDEVDDIETPVCTDEVDAIETPVCTDECLWLTPLWEEYGDDIDEIQFDEAITFP